MLQNVNLPNSWSNMPGANASPGQIMNFMGQMGQASTNANQQLGNIFASGSNQVSAQLGAQLQRAFGHLRRTNRANIRSIDRRFAKEHGDSMQYLINSGLGNSTIQGSMATGIQRAHADAISGSRAAFGNRMYDAAFQNAMANANLAQQQLNTQFQGTQIGYPDMGAFAQMAAMAGQGGGGGMGAFGGGGGLTVMPNRPIGGALPAWAHRAGGVAESGIGGGGWGFEQSYNPPPVQSTFSQAYGGDSGGIIAALASAGGGFANMAGGYLPSGDMGYGGGGDF